MKNRNSKYLIKSVMQKGSAMPVLSITCKFFHQLALRDGKPKNIYEKF